MDWIELDFCFPLYIMQSMLSKYEMDVMSMENGCQDTFYSHETVFHQFGLIKLNEGSTQRKK